MTESHHQHQGGDAYHHFSGRVKSYKAIMTATAIVTAAFLFLIYWFTGAAVSVPAMTLDKTQIAVKPSPTGAQGQQAMPTHTSAAKNNITEKKTRLLCLVLTMEKDLQTKTKAVNSTWVTRCDKYFYVISSNIRRPDFLEIDIPDSRYNLVQKIQAAYRLVYKSHMNDFDFLLKADDDSYVIVENLKYLLSSYQGNEPGYLGFHFNHYIKHGYMSGGAGYVMSNRALRDMVEKGLDKGICPINPNPDDPENSEDVETGRCLQTVGVPVWSSLDVEGRETFHPYPLEKHLLGGIPGYLFSWAKNPVQTGLNCCSRYTVSFHYLSPQSIYFMDHLLYKTTVYGLQDKKREGDAVFRIGKVT